MNWKPQRWKLKAHTLAVISRLPGGNSLYHWLQKAAGTNRLNADRDLGRAFELVGLIHESNTPIEGAECVEIGTGWRPFVPFVLALAGARRVTTYDINPWLTLEYARETWQALADRLEEIAAHCQIDLETVRERYRRVPDNATSLEQLFRPLGIHYVYPGDARSTGLPDSSVDIVLSSNVLEHIPADIQTAIHQESARILQEEGVAVHRYNPQDHYATVDSSITNGNFLRFSSSEWNWLGGTGLSYHNRLRAPDYRWMFAAAGLRLEICRERVDQRTLSAIRDGKLHVHSDFSGFSPEELAVDYMWVACRKPPASEKSSTSKGKGWQGDTTPLPWATTG